MNMKRLWICIFLMVLPVAISFAASDEEDAQRFYNDKGLVVHEWGVIGSKADGTPPYATDVPDFVKRSGGLDEAICVWKPVIYFYSDKERTITVTLRLPSTGALLHWPPATDGLIGLVDRQAERNMLKLSTEPRESQEQFLVWRDITVTKTGENWKPAEKAYEAVDKKHWWHEARSPKASWVCCNLVYEKFLFYEQAFVPAMPARVACKDGVVSLDPVVAPGDAPFYPSSILRDAIIVYVNKGVTRYCFKDKLDVSDALKFGPDDLAIADQRELAGLLQERLASAGLYTDEAASMTKIWQRQFFETDGARLIYRMEQADYDKLYPLEFSECPNELKRVILVVLEP